MNPDALVYIVDDDPHINGALADLLRSVGIASRSFLAAQDFLQAALEDLPGCLVLDVRLRGTNGLDLQEHLKQHGVDMPIIFITAHGDIEMSVRAMKAGAQDFLTKPFRDQVFLDAVSGAIEADRCRRTAVRCGLDLRTRFATLSDREREVMLLAASGLMNKQIAGRIGISEVTIKIHRSKAMRKMAARTFADLVKMVHELGAIAARQEPAFAAPRAVAMPAARMAG
ncbi:response regulator transcription factor [Cupriavidus plantarum]|uniref:LuxR family two component transcriptional regulator n=1 Tax=Cupriavidus plantarum TaxID=942865 RepID=A0A316EWE0_9BURK|nr:response regulator [Cupriavidus plantarum]NYI01069.1 FixJ family two-component response regulator [Cupriavidus plantarum]PWK35479.1 LuxR family two component transcriptional regulator [Cupriavidus plantarum]REE93933.1 LuxR family two component transcriptional regulator [Cupriavidus plantarum]RLK39344.1 LuxR family two component transcriptional regulator [Cupriavidus plantarum]CAG2134067.1 Response regulator protein TodT [Cupriavidus plantarum]